MPIDTIALDYGGVVADHYCEPFQTQLASALGTTRERSLELLSERSPQGRLYRLGSISRDEFWENVRTLAPDCRASNDVLETLWAQTYIPNQANLNLLNYLLTQVGVKIAWVMNTDEFRFNFVARSVNLPQHVSFVITSFETHAMKPELEIYRSLLDRAGRRDAPDRVLYVDDRPGHAEAPRTLGVASYVYHSAGEFALYVGSLLEDGQLIPFAT